MSSEYGVAALPAFIRGFALMHVAMRRDAQRLVQVAPAVTPARGREVAGWFSMVRSIIDWHHHSEDEILWPYLRGRVAGFAAREVAIEGNHHALDAAMDSVSAALAPGGLHELPGAAQRFRTVLVEHLRAEEALVFPVFVNELTEREYVSVEQRIVTATPVSVMTYLLPWMFDSADGRAVAQVASTIPPPVRALGQTVLRWRYDRVLRPVLALS